MADQEGNVFLTLLKDKVLWLLLRPVMLLSTLCLLYTSHSPPRRFPSKAK